MITIENKIEISASVDQVWSVLIDRDKYSLWNPVILSQTGSLQVGARAKMRINPGLFPMNVEIVYRQIKKNQELSWFGGPPLIKGHHYFKLEAMNNGHTCLIHGEVFGLVPTILAGPAIATLVKMKYKKADHAFKRRCEQLFPSQVNAA